MREIRSEFSPACAEKHGLDAKFTKNIVGRRMLAQDIAANDERPISDETVASYVDALRKIFVVEDMPAWNPNLRSKTAIRSSDTRYYIAPSIAAAALGIGPNDLINDLKIFGFLFEKLINNHYEGDVARP